MSESKVVTGHTYVSVKLASPEGAEVAVFRGQPLPDGLADGEIERLTKVGAFDEPRRADLAGQGAALAVTSARPPTVPATALTSPESPLVDPSAAPGAAPASPAVGGPSAVTAGVAPAAPLASPAVAPPPPPPPPKK